MIQSDIEHLNSSVANFSLNQTHDDLQNQLRNKEAEQNKKEDSNIFQNRIIDTEINSLLHLQIMLYFNIFLDYIVFAFELASNCYKIYVFDHQTMYYVRLFILLVWFIIAHYRINQGYYGNINEDVYSLLICALITFMFDMGFQFLMFYPNKVSNFQTYPIDYACVFLLWAIEFVEIIMMIVAMIQIGQRQTEVFRIRQTPTKGLNVKQHVKTSREIEDELFYLFPNLRDRSGNNHAHRE